MAENNVFHLLLRPVVRLYARSSGSYRDFSEIVKRLFVEVATETLQRSHTVPNASRISALTGLTRDDIKRLQENDSAAERLTPALNVIGRVIGQWENDRRFASPPGNPRPLSYRGRTSEFRKLVYTVNSHLNPGTILGELVRSGAAEKTERGLELVRREAIESTDHRRAYELLARDIDALVTSVDENLRQTNAIKNLHIHTESDNLYVKHLPAIREWVLNEGREFHRRLREHLSKFDADLNPEPDGMSEAGGRVVVTAFSVIGSNQTESAAKPQRT